MSTQQTTKRVALRLKYGDPVCGIHFNNHRKAVAMVNHPDMEGLLARCNECIALFHEQYTAIHYFNENKN